MNKKTFSQEIEEQNQAEDQKNMRVMQINKNLQKIKFYKECQNNADFFTKNFVEKNLLFSHGIFQRGF